MVASGGDPEEEALDPELIHELGLYELHDESRDGDPLGACGCPRASPRGREHPHQTREMRCVVFLPRHAANARQRAWIVPGCRGRRSRNTVRARDARPSLRAPLSPPPRVPLTGLAPSRTLGSRNALFSRARALDENEKKPRGEIRTFCARRDANRPFARGPPRAPRDRRARSARVRAQEETARARGEPPFRRGTPRCAVRLRPAAARRADEERVADGRKKKSGRVRRGTIR